jgi:hypothetical protein
MIVGRVQLAQSILDNMRELTNGQAVSQTLQP